MYLSPTKIKQISGDFKTGRNKVTNVTVLKFHQYFMSFPEKFKQKIMIFKALVCNLEEPTYL
jgi:hypothetical protein